MKRTYVVEDLRKAITESDRSLREIAEQAGVSYDSLQRWVSLRQQKLASDDAERLWFTLTGDRFTR